VQVHSSASIGKQSKQVSCTEEDAADCIMIASSRIQ